MSLQDLYTQPDPLAPRLNAMAARYRRDLRLGSVGDLAQSLVMVGLRDEAAALLMAVDKLADSLAIREARG